MTRENETFSGVSKRKPTSQEEKKLIEAREQKLSDLSSLSERVANNLYSPDDKMWNVLLKFRDKMESEAERLTNKLDQLKREEK